MNRMKFNLVEAFLQFGIPKYSLLVMAVRYGPVTGRTIPRTPNRSAIEITFSSAA
jgi:hypothetical protein